MAAHRIDGARIAADLRLAIAADVATLVAAGIRPGLAVVLVGDDPASRVYVAAKAKQTVAAGMASFEHRLSFDVAEGDLLALIDRLNEDDRVDGILVQLPLPPHIDGEKILRAIDPTKDVDGFHPLNAGLLAIGGGGFVPCTPRGAMMLLASTGKSLAGLNAVVIGRSNIVGKPMAQLLLKESCTVTIAHSCTTDLPTVVRSADIVVAAVGRPEMVRGDWIKAGATVIDVGINRIATGEGGTKLVGDVCYEEAAQRAEAITPVPGGVGPMTIACLLRNTVDGARRRLS